MDEKYLDSWWSNLRIEDEVDVNNLSLDERIKQFTQSLLEWSQDINVGSPTEITNIKKSLNFSFAIVDSILQKSLKVLLPQIEIKSPDINFWEKSCYFRRHEIQIWISDVGSDNIDLLIVIAHEYWHAIIYELIRKGLLPSVPEENHQEQFCDFIAGHCLQQYHKNFEWAYYHWDYTAARVLMKGLWDISEWSSILHIRSKDPLFSEFRDQKKVKGNAHGTWTQRRKRLENWYSSGEKWLIIALANLVHKGRLM